MIVEKCASMCKKVAKSFVDSKTFRTFAAMKPKLYIITGVNRLTNMREQLSRPMEEQEAKDRLERELANRRHQLSAAHKIED